MMEEIPDVCTIFGKIIIYTWNLKDLMSGQPTPPNVHPLEIRPYYGLINN